MAGDGLTHSWAQTETVRISFRDTLAAYHIVIFS